MSLIPKWDMVRDLFPASERRRLIIVLASAIAAAVMDTLGVASIAPFMGIVLDDTLMDRTPWLSRFLGLLGATTQSERLTTMGILTLVAILVGNLTSATSYYLQQSFVARSKRRLSSELFAAYMASPYAFHVRRDAPSLLKVIYEDLDNAVGVIQHALSIIARGLVLIALVALLVIKSPVIAVGTILILGGSYVIAYRVLRRRQRLLGNIMTRAYDDRARTVQEALGGVKELIVLGRTGDSIRRFDAAMSKISDAWAENSLAGALPRYLLESVAYGGLVIVTLLLVTAEGGVRAAIPTLALFAFAAYRLMPSLQQLFSSAVTLRFSQGSLDVLLSDWREVRRLAAQVGPQNAQAGVTIAETSTRKPPTIELHDVSMTYEGVSQSTLRSISLTIRPGESIGIVGRTGAGKTTLVDLILGLHRPDSGSICFDKAPLSGEGRRMLPRLIGYVPQHVFLANATVAENIAFGIPVEGIDTAAVRRAAALAQAEEFILRLPAGYESIVGERGVKLSGGQRQRLGIARALYHQPSVLVFDEATSALDGLTEAALMKAIRQLAGEHTVILIAHRLKTVEACDRIILLEGGSIVGDGSWSDLLTSNPKFIALVRGPSVEAVA